MRKIIIDLLKNNKDLPSLPEIVVKMEELLADPDAKLSDIAKLIETEATLSGKIITLSNSVYYRGISKITTIPMAIRRLGLNLIRDLTYSLVLTKLFINFSFMNTQQFWIHSFAVASFSRSLAKRMKLYMEEKEMAFLCGLMHDIGILVFLYLIPEEYTNFLRLNFDENKTMENLERENFGIDHAEVGAIFIEQCWDIDKEIVLAVRQHHFNFKGSLHESHYSQIVNIANFICNREGINNGITLCSKVFKKDAWQELVTNIIDTDEIIKEVELSLDEAKALLYS